MRQSAQNARATYAAGALLRGVLCACCLAAPLSQLVWLQEIRPASTAEGEKGRTGEGETAAAHYRVILDQTVLQERGTAEHAAGDVPAEPGRQPKAPARLLKALTDHWDTATALHFVWVATPVSPPEMAPAMTVPPTARVVCSGITSDAAAPPLPGRGPPV